MPILGIMASQISGHLVTNSYESIQTYTLGSDAASVTFSSIPATFKHLQVRLIGRDTFYANSDTNWQVTFNGDTASNYSYHGLIGDGSSASASSGASTSFMYIAGFPTDGATASVYGAGVLDILDYANTNKYKTLRELGGYDKNGAGFLGLRSGNWRSTNAISSLTITPQTGIKQYSSFALYGIK
jgi:ABC-type xylose transport system substrate-binding protein